MKRTPQRKAIQDVFVGNDRPLRVEDVLELAQTVIPSINLATVYRNLGRLLHDGWLRRVEFPPLGTLYERAGKPHHHHFHCRTCDALFELPGCLLDSDKLAPDRFRLEGHELFLYGLCQSCAEEKPAAIKGENSF
jgi:Fur family ferric uptake transcriptional regulator